MKPKFFPTQQDFRRWLEENHHQQNELLVGFYKAASEKPSMTWPQSVDEALCFGWIDGVRRKIDDESYSIRFTPRKANSVWSAVNIKKVGELTQKDLMHPAGLAAFSKRTEGKSRIYAYENELKQLTPDFEKQFKASKAAWIFFEKQPNWYRKKALNWVMTAKQETTRRSRLEKLIGESENDRQI